MKPSNKTITDADFGELQCTYAYEVAPQWWPRYGLTAAPAPIGEIWSRPLALPFLKRFSHIAFNVHSADWANVLSKACVEGAFTALQRNVFLQITRNWADIEAQASAAILEYYHGCLKLIDYPAGEYLPVADVAALAPLIEAPSIHLYWIDEPPEEFELTVHCTWTGGEIYTMRFEDGKLVSTES